MTWLDYKTTLIALTIYREARSEGKRGMQAVANVIANRIHGGWGDAIKVLTTKNQFSSITVKGDSQTIVFPAPPNPDFEYCMQLAQAVMDNKLEDISGGALYYANLGTASSGWFFDKIVSRKKVTLQSGNHTFFSDEDKPA